MGLYAMWALRNEIARMAAPELLPRPTRRLRLEDLLGFRRNPITTTPLFRRFSAKALDGHPTPATPFVRLSTGASGVGVATRLGLAFGARDYYGADAPRVHIVEGEGGLTPGRVAEALAAAGTASLGNAVLHLDWNQASIDSNRVCRDGERPGDYVQWTPARAVLPARLERDLRARRQDFQQVCAAQRAALEPDNGQPTAIVYRTVKGWKYGIEGRASHGAGHKLCSRRVLQGAVAALNGGRRRRCPPARPATQRCSRERRRGRHGGVLLGGAAGRARASWSASARPAAALARSPARPRGERLDARGRASRAPARRGWRRSTRRPRPSAADDPGGARAGAGRDHHAARRARPGAQLLQQGLRAARCSWPAADLLGSTSVNVVAQGFPHGFWNADGEPGGAPALHRRHLRGRA